MTRTTRAFVDAIEAGIARVLAGGHQPAVSLPSAWLPDGAAEGSWIEIAITPGEAPDDDTEARRKRLASSDPGGDISL